MGFLDQLIFGLALSIRTSLAGIITGMVCLSDEQYHPLPLGGHLSGLGIVQNSGVTFLLLGLYTMGQCINKI